METKRLAVNQSNVGGIDMDGRRYRARDGFVEVPAHLAERAVRYGDCFEPAGVPRASGFVCEECGFHALIRTCGRCGGRCHRPGETPDGQPEVTVPAPDRPLYG